MTRDLELEKETVKCERHGPSRPPTFACKHLVAGPAPGFNLTGDELETPWPDALCDACDAAFEDWSDQEMIDNLSTLCKYCWEDAFKRSTHIEPHSDPKAWLHEARHRAGEKQDRWLAKFDITKYPHYQMELGEELAWLGFGETAQNIHVTCDALVIGSWSAKRDTWLWGWANTHWESALTYPLVAVKRFGEQKGIEQLWRSMNDMEEDEAFALAAAVLDLMPNIEGVYRAPTDNGSLFLAVSKTRRVS